MHPRAISLVAALAASLLLPGARPVAAQVAQNPLAALEPLLGAWGAPPAALEQRPELEHRVIHDYSWTVGENALRVRESYSIDAPDEAEFEGLVYLHPDTGELGMIGVAGRGEGQGRLFQCTYRVLEDGRIERDYEVFYRTPADMPAAELGGTSRRFREVYTIEGDTLAATLDWWRDGAWQPFGPGTYELVRRD